MSQQFALCLPIIYAWSKIDFPPIDFIIISKICHSQGFINDLDTEIYVHKSDGEKGKWKFGQNSNRALLSRK